VKNFSYALAMKPGTYELQGLEMHMSYPNSFSAPITNIKTMGGPEELWM